MTFIPYGRQNIDADDIRAVVEVLQSEFITQGPAIPAFENAVADYCCAEHAVAVNNATSALHVACLALGVGFQDVVWTSPVTFVATANCARYCGAEIDFVDIDPQTFNICVDSLEAKLIQAERDGCLPKVVIPVHLCGQSCNMVKISELAKRFGFGVIEDASHAVGAKYMDRQVGSCDYSDIAIFSFHPVKIVTTGEGGMALTNTASLAKKMQLLRSHAVTRDTEQMLNAPDGDWYYEQVDLGFNYRMTDIQAALGLSQLRRLDYFVEQRNLLATRYNELLAELPITLPFVHTDVYSSFHLYVIQLQSEIVDSSHKEVFKALRDRGIGVNLHYMPVYLQPYYKNLGFSRGHCPNAEEYYSRAISIPLYPALTEEDQFRVSEALAEAVGI